MLRKLLILFLFLSSGPGAFSQVYEGGSLNVGFALGQGSAPGYTRVFQEYNDLRPWLDKQADLPERRYGLSIGLLGYSDHLLFGFNLSGFKTATSVHGIDSNGNELRLTYMVKSSGFEMMYGFYLVNQEKFRITPMFGIGFYNEVVKQSPKTGAQRWASTAWRILFMKPGGEVRAVDDHFFMAGRIALSVAVGTKNAFSIEPFYTIPFWKVNAKKTRDILNNDAPSAYPDKAFKGYVTQWGVRMMFCFGFSN